MFTCNVTSKGQVIAKQDAFRVIACIVYAQLLSEHKIVAQNKKTIASLGDRSPGRRIMTTRSYHKISQANQIVWNIFIRSNQIVRTNKFTRSNQIVQTNKFSRSNQIVWTNKLTRSNQIVQTNKFTPSNQIVRTNKFIRSNQIVRTNKIAPDRLDCYITVTFFEVIKKIVRLLDRYITVTFFEVIEKIGRLLDRYITVTFFEVREDWMIIGPLYYGYII